MKYFLLVHAVNCLEQVFNYKGCGFLGEIFMVRNQVVELAIWPELLKCIEVCLIMKKTINIDDIWMIQEDLDFKFSDKLLQNIIVYNFPFFLHFHSHQKASCYLSHHIHFAKFALSDFFQDFKILTV